MLFYLYNIVEIYRSYISISTDTGQWSEWITSVKFLHFSAYALLPVKLNGNQYDNPGF